MPRTTLTTLALLLGLVLSTGTTLGAEIGHYTPGVLNIRDFAMTVTAAAADPHLELGHQPVPAAVPGPDAPARSRSRRLQ